MTEEPAWGSSGKVVFDRTYSRTKPNGDKESWADCVARVAEGNLTLVNGERTAWSEETSEEYDDLYHAMYDFKILPAGRHLWAGGIKGRQYLQNCFVSGWTEKLSDHFEFTFMRLMEGGGVGANYSEYLTGRYGAPRQHLDLHIVCDDEHRDFAKINTSALYSESWDGAYQVQDSREGWAAALTDLIDTFYRDDVKHSQRVYDVSLIRPEGAKLKTYGGTASGPAPFARMLQLVTERLNTCHRVGTLDALDLMDIDHAIAQCVVAGGVRRSARMSIVKWDDPAIFDFIACKSDFASHWTTNISVQVDDEFFGALKASESHANAVLQAVAIGMLKNGEPGFWNSSLSNEGELTPVHATNPCGEICLVDFEPCTLGHVNLEAFIRDDTSVDSYGLYEAHRLMTRFLIRATYGDKNDVKQAEIMEKNRRIGVGHFGVQGFLAKQGIKYSEASDNVAVRAFLVEMHDHVRSSARDYAFQLRIAEPIKVTTVAPTGTIAKLAGVSEGIHPIYARYFNRRIRFSIIRPEEAAQVAEFAKQGYAIEDDQYDESGNTKVVVFPSKDKLVAEVEALGFDESVVESADEISLDNMLRFQAMYQASYADNAVSFTANVAEGAYSVDQLIKLLRVYLPQVKGSTIMVDATRPQAPYERVSKADYELAEYLGSVDTSNDEECTTGACPVR